jgi:hypothetical protein
MKESRRGCVTLLRPIGSPGTTLRLCCLALLASAAHLDGAWLAQERKSLGDATVAQLDCRFTASASVRWQDGTPQADIDPASTLEFQLTNINTDRGTADYMYGAVSVPATVLSQGSALHFIAPPENGVVVMTSVTIPKGPSSKWRASYSRTAYYAFDGPGFRSTPRAEQRYGYCQPTPP